VTTPPDPVFAATLDPLPRVKSTIAMMQSPKKGQARLGPMHRILDIR